jgi:hypothetical protein
LDRLVDVPTGCDHGQLDYDRDEDDESDAHARDFTGWGRGRSCFVNNL